MTLPGPVTTAAGGFAIALQMQARAAPGTSLARVVVVVGREAEESEGSKFEVTKLIYGFDPIIAGERRYTVTVDNTTRRVAGTNDTQRAQSAGGFEALPVSLAGKDVWEALGIARENGLNDLCSMVTPENESILFTLENSLDNGLTWHIAADGWDQKRGTFLLRMDIDAISGAVSHRSFRAVPKQ